MSCEACMTEETPRLFCLGRCPRASWRRCAFCDHVAAGICDGERCIRPICDHHRWSARDRLDLCPLCESKLGAAAVVPKQAELFAPISAPESSSRFASITMTTRAGTTVRLMHSLSNASTNTTWVDARTKPDLIRMGQICWTNLEVHETAYDEQ